MSQVSCKNVLVIGAGASGLTAAICAARSGAQVVVLDGDVKPCRKLLRTGNGRCNLSNACIEVNGRAEIDCTPLRQYHNAAFALEALQKMGCTRTREFFHEIGLETYEDFEGRIYPFTNKARSVADVLINECELLRVSIELEAQVCQIDATSEKQHMFAVRCIDGRVMHADAVILATGSSFELAASVGLPIEKNHPVLGPLHTGKKPVSGMANVRMRCKIGIADSDNKTLGEVLFRKDGISGVVVFDLSRGVVPGDVIELDLMPFMSLPQLSDEIDRRIKRAAEFGSSDAVRVFDGLLQREVTSTMLELCGLNIHSPASKINCDKMATQIKGLRLNVLSGPAPEEAQVTRGGINASAVSAQTMECIQIPGLFACGEALNVDGACGGYNLQWAWASGALAGTNAAKKLKN